jgi:3-dehydroquinate dehydratase-1
LTIKVCVSVPPKTVEEVVCLIEEAEAQHADFIEVRLDSLTEHDRIEEIPLCSKTPLIATNKSVEYHGSFSGSEEERQQVLLEAARSGFEYVDIDLFTPNMRDLLDELRETGTKTVISFHDFDMTPELSRLKLILDEEIALGAEVCKIVTTAKSFEDNLTTLNLVSEASKKTNIVCFAMGELGKPSRLLSPVFGAFFTFASLDEKKKTAKGQLTIQEMNKAYELLGIK